MSDDESIRHDPTQGVGIEFETHGTKYVTVLKGPRRVVPRIYSWGTMVSYAVHWYGELRARDLMVKDLKDGSLSSLSSPNYPKEAKGFLHTVKDVLDRDVIRYDPVSAERVTDAKKGKRSNIMFSRDQATKRLKEDFEELFGEGWVLDDWRHILDYDGEDEP